MKVKLNDYIIEHNDVTSIERIVSRSVSRYIEISYIEAKVYQPTIYDIPVILDDKQKRRTLYTWLVSYKAIPSPYGKICNLEYTVRENTLALLEEFARVYDFIIENDVYFYSNEPHNLPKEIKYKNPTVTPDNRYQKEKDEMSEILKFFAYDDFPEEGVQDFWFQLFHRGRFRNAEHSSTEQKIEYLKDNIEEFKEEVEALLSEYNYFHSSAWELKQARVISGLSQKEVCDRLEIPLTTWKQWESNARECPRYTVKLIIEKLKEFGEESLNEYRK